MVEEGDEEVKAVEVGAPSMLSSLSSSASYCESVNDVRSRGAEVESTVSLDSLGCRPSRPN